MSEKCSICDEEFTSCFRKKINCINDKCDSKYCLECFKNYLLKSPDYSQSCPVCSVSLSLKDVFDKCNSASFIKAIMERITNIALKRFLIKELLKFGAKRKARKLQLCVFK